MRDVRWNALIVAASVLMMLGPQTGTPATSPRAVVQQEVFGEVEPVDVIVHFRGRMPRLAPIDGLDIRYVFRSIPAAYARASLDVVHVLASRSDVSFIERADIPITFALETATLATRARDVFDPAFDPSTPPLTIDGAAIDGTGIGIAIVDTGLDGLHPDFAAGKIGGNHLVTPGGVVPAPTTATNRHGTHVAGIAAGTGQSSGGAFRGAAPGATVYGFSIAAGGAIVFPAIAFDWILTHGHEQRPPIRIVNNSWHCGPSTACSRFNPDLAHNRLATMMAERGLVVTFAAGNEGGDGFLAVTSAESQNPTPGIISVANYDDQNAGSRAGCPSHTSSRGAAIDPSTWPDVAAPGTSITSTNAMAPDPPGPSRTPTGANAYVESSGTSMAAPHVAGIAALMLQAGPSLTPAEIEYILKSTATKLSCPPSRASSEPVGYVRADPAHPYDGANFVDGHGLVDARAAVEAALTFGGIPPAPEPEPLPDRFLRIREAVEPERTLYLNGDALSERAPGAGAPPRLLVGDEPVVYTSAPFPSSYTTSGVELRLWIGTDGEWVTAKAGDPAFGLQVKVERISDAAAVSLAEKEVFSRFTFPGLPIYRQFVFPLTAEETFAEGDRLRLTVTIRSDLAPSGISVDDAKFVGFVYQDETTPSAVALGRKVAPVLPGTELECQVRFDCASIGGERRFVSLWCGADPLVAPLASVEWTGPPGSMAGLVCQGMTAVCVVPGMPGDPWGTCRAETAGKTAFKSHDSLCFYRLPDGARGGSGRCVATPPISGGQ